MKLLTLSLSLFVSLGALAQNHEHKPIRFIFESIHDHLGNMDLNSKRVQLFSQDHRLIYEADLYEGKELDEQFFYYNTDGKLTRDHRIFHERHESGDYRMIYDEKGNLVEERNVNDIEEVIERKTMTYDGKGNMTSQKVEFLHHEGNKMIVESYFEFTYDDKGRVLSKTGYEGEKEDEKVTYKYTHTDNSESISRYDASDKITEKWTKTFNDKGWLIEDEHTTYSDGREVTKTVNISYDEFGHILEEEMTKSGSQVKIKIVFEYVYDDYGNWIERKETKYKGAKETPGNHLKRYIEYYEHDDYDHDPMELDETYTYETRNGEEVRVFQETHVRINNNEGQLEWVVRRKKQELYQIDEFEYEDGKLVHINHLLGAKDANDYINVSYNDKGLRKEDVAYNKSNHVEEKTSYSYDKKGNLIKMEEHFLSAANNELTIGLVEEYTYDASGNLIKTIQTNDGSRLTIEYEYNNGGTLNKSLYSPSSKDEDIVEEYYSYEGTSLVSKSIKVGKAKEPQTIIKYEYNEFNELVSETEYRNGKIHKEVKYVYFR